MEHRNEFDSMLGHVDFDEVTGQVLPEKVAEQQEIVKQAAIEEGEKLTSLSKHAGWKLVKHIMEETIAKEKHALLFARSLDFITLTQAKILARIELLDWLDIKMSEAKSLLEEQQ